MIHLPTLREIGEITHILSHDKRAQELFENECEILDREREASDNPIIKYRLGNFPKLLDGFKRVAFDRLRQAYPRGTLRAVVKWIDGEEFDLGLISVGVVTTAGVNFLVDAFQNSVEIELMRFHGSGTGTTAEAVGDTALVTEVDSRVSGNQAEGASANIYHTEAELTYTANRAITEHGLFSASSAGTLWDRGVFSVINASTTVNILFKYEVTFPSGG